MRQLHSRKPLLALAGAPRGCYVEAMKHLLPSARLLRLAAAAALLAGLGTWLASGAHPGWSRTSTVMMQKDEVTGIDYPVRRAGFVAGIEVPLAGIVAAGALAALSLLPRRRPAPQAG